MNLQTFKIIHITAVLLLFYSFGAMAVGASTDKAERKKSRFYKALHGLALLIILVTGMGQLGLLKIGFPAWVKIKLAVWLLLGGSAALVMRKPQWRKWIWVLLIGLASVAVAAAVIR